METVCFYLSTLEKGCGMTVLPLQGWPSGVCNLHIMNCVVSLTIHV
jgi:hypothetical protein